MRRAASLAASRTWRSVRLLFRLARVLSVLLFLFRLPELLDVELSREPEEPRLLRDDLLLLPLLSSDDPEVSPLVEPAESFEVVSVLPVSSVLAVELELLLLLAFFLEQPVATRAKTMTARAMRRNLIFIVDRSPYDGGFILKFSIQDSSFDENIFARARTDRRWYYRPTTNMRYARGNQVFAQ